MTSQPWPHFNESPGYLTEKGFLLEEFMGKYFSEWLYMEDALPNKCPLDEEFYVYANSIQRTLFSAQAFVNSAFPNCNVTIHHETETKTDPIFSPYIHNSSAIFKKIALKEMKNVLDNLKLDFSYQIMENILDYNDSDLCKIDRDCNMVTDKNKLQIAVGKKPKLSGPLKICNEAVDEFIMAYYNGFAMKDIAWGKLNNTEQWLPILDLMAGYHNVIFNTTHVANDIAKPLIKYMTDRFINKTSKIILLMGHDANINVILNAMSFKFYNLEDSFVSTPVGGKIVFQKWYNIHLNEYYLKINYIYQSNEQLREAHVLSLKTPPKSTLLELSHCKMDENGLCPWDDFIKFLNSL
ncbi:unnamed protein product [Euphydryas editha]|uniref:Glucose-1-phosphatase n=1 Tax=Euphydryas editha TaxID=104508 RepID=A0AAU9UQ13_EUPED|nr:unnamed protein product [Euphydryas editha]